MATVTAPHDPGRERGQIGALRGRMGPSEAGGDARSRCLSPAVVASAVNRGGWTGPAKGLDKNHSRPLVLLCFRFTRGAHGMAAERTGLIHSRFEVLLAVTEGHPLLAIRRAAPRLAFTPAIDGNKLFGGRPFDLNQAVHHHGAAAIPAQ